MIPGGQSVVSECLALLIVVIFIFASRIASRKILLWSFRKFQFDDYVMILNVALFIIVVSSIWVQCLWGNNYVTPADIAAWTEEDFHKAIEGAKWGVVMQICKISCVWGCKACLLILYAHMTKGLPKYHRAVTVVAVYVATGYFIVMICFFTAWCHPFHAYYDMIPLPDSQAQCMTYWHHMILDACFNITSDAVMLCLPIPLVIKAQIPRLRKLVLVGVFSLGTVVILCAVLNRITNFTAPYGSLIYLNWYAGETATAVMVANAPHLWPIISRLLKLGAFKQTSGPFHPNALHPNSLDGAGISSTQRGMNNHKGYEPTSSGEAIAKNNKEGLRWGHSIRRESSAIGTGHLELDKGYFSTNIRGGTRSEVDVQEHLVGREQPGGKSDPNKGQIVKTIDINQYTSGP